MKKIDSTSILQIDYTNAESLKSAELLEQQEEMSIRMASIVKIRNNIYYTLVGCFKANFKIEFLLQNCNLVKRLMDDL